MIFQNPLQPIVDFIDVWVRYWDHILAGFIITMWLYIWALIIGFFLGLILAIVRQYGWKISSWIATGYIEIMRGTPLLTQLLFFFFLPTSLGIPFGTWSFQTTFTIFDRDITLILLDQVTLIGILTLSLNSAAYQAEYFRGAIMSVSTGQLLASQSVGMSRLAGIRYIVLPQALRRVIPAWSNEAAYLPKYTTVVYFIGVKDIFREAKYIVSESVLSLTTYISIALVFLVTISIISKLLDIIHKRTSIPGL